MARLGSKRVKDVLDYERDIKGKGLIRLRAGVGSGKNYWVRHLPESHPELQILMITSRKNVAQAEAIRLGTDNRIYLSRLIDVDDREWYEDYSGSLMVCTNAYIQHFLSKIYSIENPHTYLWNKFDVIFVDEAHSLAADADFADSSFHVAQFIRHARRNNPRCDIVLMSGTQEPIDWLFTEEFLDEEYTTLDLYDTCVHLVPDVVSMMKKEVVAERIFNIWSRGSRLIYFVNSVAAMAELIKKLKALNIPEEDMAVAYTKSENESLLPETLVAKKEDVRKFLIGQSKLPPEVKIFITTTQNKEGISIEDDDIKYMFSENHNKADLEQMAGRVRGNPDTGTGIRTLVVVYDAADQWIDWSFLECELDRKLDGQVKEILDRHKEAYTHAGQEYLLEKDIKAIEKKHRYLRYDYIRKEFAHFTGREKCENQNRADRDALASYMECFDEILYYWNDRSGHIHAATGRSELKDEWFPYSRVYSAPDRILGPKEEAAKLLLDFLQRNILLDVEITPEQGAMVIEEIRRLIVVYGREELGFSRRDPITLGPALRKFNMECTPASHRNRNKVITLRMQP